MDKELVENSENQENKDVSVENNSEFYSGYSPLDEPVKQRDYTTPNIDTSNLEAELEEPVFNAPNFEDFDSESQEPNSFNPAIENLDKKEQMYATEQMVDTVLDVYDKAHILANRTVKIKEEKIAEAMEDGEISPSLEVPIDERGNIRTDNVNSTERISSDKPINAVIDTPAASHYGFYLDGDGVAPNGHPAGFGISFPNANVNKGDYFL